MKLFLWFQILNNLKQLLLLERGELQTLKTERTKIKEQKDEQYIKTKLVYVGGGGDFYNRTDVLTRKRNDLGQASNITKDDYFANHN